VAVKFPGLFPGLRKDPLLRVTAPTVPDPSRLPPEFTVTPLAVPLTVRLPKLPTVVPELLAILPLTNRFADETVVAPE
jgi:hypothetical protein